MEDVLHKEIFNSAPTTGEPVIKIEHLKKSFGSHEVLKDVNLSVNKGENIVVLGKSGSGKSVLIQCIIGLMKPDSGNLFVLGKDVNSLNKKDLNELRVKIGFLFQSGALYDSMNVRENLEFPLTRHLKGNEKREIESRVKEALANVGLEDAIDKMPSELSGGMRKRIGLARSMILKPEIMLYDEPSTGLDPITSREISELILDVQKKQNVTSIIITHDLACAKITANRIVVLSNGKYIAEGSYEELEKSNDKEVRSFFEE